MPNLLSNRAGLAADLLEREAVRYTGNPEYAQALKHASSQARRLALRLDQLSGTDASHELNTAVDAARSNSAQAIAAGHDYALTRVWVEQLIASAWLIAANWGLPPKEQIS